MCVCVRVCVCVCVNVYECMLIYSRLFVKCKTHNLIKGTEFYVEMYEFMNNEWLTFLLSIKYNHVMHFLGLFHVWFEPRIFIYIFRIFSQLSLSTTNDNKTASYHLLIYLWNNLMNYSVTKTLTRNYREYWALTKFLRSSC